MNQHTHASVFSNHSPLPFRATKIVTADGVSVKILDAAGDEVAVMRSAHGRKEGNAALLTQGLAGGTSALDLASFHNCLRILRGIDLHELQEQGLFADGSAASWERFRDSPHDFLIRCDDDTAAGIWAAVVARMPNKQ